MSIATVTVGTLRMELEERTCEGGCGRKFKVLPTSSSRTARRDCAAVCKGSIDDAIKANELLLRGAKKPGGSKRGKKDAPSKKGAYSAHDDDTDVEVRAGEVEADSDAETDVEADELEVEDEAG